MISEIYVKADLHLRSFCFNLLSMTNLLSNLRYQRPASLLVFRAVAIIIGIILVGVGVIQVPLTPA